MSSLESLVISERRRFDKIASELNKLRRVYGFTTSVKVTSVSHEDKAKREVIVKLSLLGGCFGIRSCPIFETQRCYPYQMTDIKAELYSQAIIWCKDNQSKLPLSYKEEQQYLDLGAKWRLAREQEPKLADDFQAYVENELDRRVHLASQDQVGSVISGIALDSSSMSSDIVKLQLETSSKDTRGIKRTMDDDTEMVDDTVEILQKLEKQAAKRAKVLALLADL